MRLVDTSSLDVYFNLAAESYFLYDTEESVLILWRSNNAVVCGKHQNICAEINVDYCKRNNIHPARRISGGGTVFHDLGNVNFTFIQPLKFGIEKAVDYKQFLEPVREVLMGMGIATSYSVRHDLLYGKDKISGNAQHIYQQKKRVLHHGTLLFNANLSALGDALHPVGVYVDRAVKSNRSTVTNLADHFSEYRDMEKTLLELKQGFERIYETEFKELQSEEISTIAGICNDKFKQDAWILGYSPSFSVSKVIPSKDSTNLNWEWTIQKGIIESLMISGGQGLRLFEKESKEIAGKPYWSSAVKEIFFGNDIFDESVYYQIF